MSDNIHGTGRNKQNHKNQGPQVTKGNGTRVSYGIPVAQTELKLNIGLLVEATKARWSVGGSNCANRGQLMLIEKVETGLAAIDHGVDMQGNDLQRLQTLLEERDGELALEKWQHLQTEGSLKTVKAERTGFKEQLAETTAEKNEHWKDKRAAEGRAFRFSQEAEDARKATRVATQAAEDARKGQREARQDAEDAKTREREARQDADNAREGERKAMQVAEDASKQQRQATQDAEDAREEQRGLKLRNSGLQAKVLEAERQARELTQEIEKPINIASVVSLEERGPQMWLLRGYCALALPAFVYMGFCLYKSWWLQQKEESLREKENKLDTHGRQNHLHRESGGPLRPPQVGIHQPRVQGTQATQQVLHAAASALLHG